MVKDPSECTYTEKKDYIRKSLFRLFFVDLGVKILLGIIVLELADHYDPTRGAGFWISGVSMYVALIVGQMIWLSVRKAKARVM